MTYYVCVHNPDEFVRQALKVGMDGLCPGIWVGKEGVQGTESREVYPVEADSLDVLQCWILDVNAECQRQWQIQDLLPSPKLRHLLTGPASDAVSQRPDV